jgi:ribonuclease HII
LTVKRTRIGIDENGLGSRLGPLVVTSVFASTSDETSRKLDEGLISPKCALLDDSKRLVSHHDVRLGEAWARALAGDEVTSPSQLVEAFSLYPKSQLQTACPSHVKSQCWAAQVPAFAASSELVDAVREQLATLNNLGLCVQGARTALICTRSLNEQLALGNHRFLVDLHAMEQLVLEQHERAKTRVIAVCGKVGGMADYTKFFGPLAGRLHTVVEQTKHTGAYDFPGLGLLRFEQDADAKDPLVMIASLIGKYLRELFMARIAGYYSSDESRANRPSGYHDSVTNAFVEATTLVRKQRRVPFDCFERKRKT